MIDTRQIVHEERENISSIVKLKLIMLKERRIIRFKKLKKTEIQKYYTRHLKGIISNRLKPRD